MFQKRFCCNNRMKDIMNQWASRVISREWLNAYLYIIHKKEQYDDIINNTRKYLMKSM